MANLINAFANGALRIEQLYVALFNKIPDKYSYYNESLLLDTNYLTREKCAELFGDVEVSIRIDEHIYSTSKVDEIRAWDDDSGTFKDKNVPSVIVVDHHKQLLYMIDYNSVLLYSSNYDRVKEDVKELIKKLPSQPKKSKTASIDLVAYDHNYYTINSKIRKTEIDFATHYNDDFPKIYEKTIKFLNEQESGLIIWHGEKGSGKTSAIRHLISNTDKKYILVTNAIAAHMAEPEFIAFMMENKDSIFILEDCEQILMAREENRFGGAIANILNMSDGLMSDIFNIKFICTFNTDIENIDEALLRPGRCFVNYEFKSLEENKAAKLLEQLGHSVSKPRKMTLAEIYNYQEESETKAVKRIGF